MKLSIKNIGLATERPSTVFWGAKKVVPYISNSSICLSCILLVLCWIAVIFPCSAQTVPGKMMIGDVELKINESARKQIQKDVDRLTQSETYYNILVDRMNLYFPFIERAHQAAGIPNEIKFLSIQESALISDAVSSANAVGFWQFKDFTAREVGLRVDRQIDERLNIVSASKGSGKYFNSNNFFFDNWAYAVIAYQAGPGGAKAHTNKKNYGQKKLTITTNSYWYLKKFIAHVVAFSPAVGRPHSEGLWLEELTDVAGKSLYQIARQEKVELEELKKYNKWLKVGSVPKDKGYSVLVPRQGSKPQPLLAKDNKKPAKIGSYNKSTAKTTATNFTLPDGTTLIPINDVPAMLSKPNDDLQSISARAGLSTKAFMKYNDLVEGQEIVPNKFYFVQKKKAWAKVEFHTSQSGETLWSISQKYGIRLLSLAKKNRIESAKELKEGRVLWLRKKRPKNTPIEYKKAISPQRDIILSNEPNVKNEMPVSAISTDEISDSDKKRQDEAIKTETVLQDPTEEDPGSNSENIEAIEVPVVDAVAARKKVMIHTVAKGETLTSIAKLYEINVADLLRWNQLEDPNAIEIGQNVRVKKPVEEASKEKGTQTHTVQSGETLYAISRKYNMTVDEVMELNALSNFNLDAGQELKVYKSEE
ncbi:MAG: LysM peptidoglycan-binding domain-containing protein [Bacteroidota bacterium]